MISDFLRIEYISHNIDYFTNTQFQPSHTQSVGLTVLLYKNRSQAIFSPKTTSSAHSWCLFCITGRHLQQFEKTVTHWQKGFIVQLIFHDGTTFRFSVFNYFYVWVFSSTPKNKRIFARRLSFGRQYAKIKYLYKIL